MWKGGEDLDLNLSNESQQTPSDGTCAEINKFPFSLRFGGINAGVPKHEAKSTSSTLQAQNVGSPDPRKVTVLALIPLSLGTFMGLLASRYWRRVVYTKE